MNNIITSFDTKVSPVALATPPSHALSGGKVSHASDLLKAFTADAFDTTRIQCLMRMAGMGLGQQQGDALTCDEFKAECKQAQELASNTDTLSGFIKPADAKGQDQYGPVRRVLNQRLSEAKNIFGVLKMDSSVVLEKGYVPALEAARAFLADKGVKWDGSKAPTEAQKAIKATREALSDVMEETPQEQYETLGEYMARCTALVEDKLQENALAAKEKALQRVVTSLEKAHGKDILADLFAHIVDVADIDSLKDMANYIYEAQMLQKAENV